MSAQRTLALRVATLGVLGVFIVVGHAHTLECPASIPVQQSVATATVAPWAAYDRKQGPAYNFYGVAFSDGPPPNRVFLTPSKTVQSKDAKQEIYDFKSARITAVWLLCLYRDTSIALSKKIEPAVVRCRVSYDSSTQFRTVKMIDCD